MEKRSPSTGISLLTCALAVMLAGGVFGTCLSAHDAFAVTAAEKQAEADAVYAQIDSLQTSLNETQARFEQASNAHDEAVAQRDEAARQIEEETARIDELQADLSTFAVGMYKKGGSGSFIDVLLETSSFDDFITSWDACKSISNKGTTLLDEEKHARNELAKARSTFEEQSARAEEEMGNAEAAMKQITNTQAALRAEAEKLSAEADELQLKEELEAEAARQAEEARKAQEEALAAAYNAGASSDDAAAAGAEAGASVLMGDGYFTNPCPTATSSSGFGYRTFDNSFHKGLDMAAPEGTPYYAADSGTVMYATNGGGWNGGAGNWVVISHGNGIVTKYMHSQVTYVKPGDQVERGQNIGLVGQTGEAFGAHLHFQIEVDGVAVNPLNYI